MKDYLKQCTAQVDAQLERILPIAEGPAERLFAAMRYSVFNGGKRIRPALCFAAASAVVEPGTHQSATLVTASVAAAIEMIHAYSLIHDDLPAMDDDDLRRGKPTCHIQFDEATAILAGDALQSLAFQQLTELANTELSNQEFSHVNAETALKLVSILSRYGGCSGMVTGQAIDLAATGQQVDIDQLKNMHAHKTGALIEASVLMGAVATNTVTEQQLDALTGFARAIGLAFQIQDDILDVESSTEQLGKQQGSDIANGKSTYTSILGLEQARSQVAELYQHSMDCLESFGKRADALRFIARFIVNRAY